MFLTLFLILALGLTTNLGAQDFNDYQLLNSSGIIPADFLTRSSIKYEKEIQSLDSITTKDEKNDKRQFYLESNFLIDDLLKGPSVFFNDPITSYVNKVADELLKNDQEMRKKLQFYTVRSSAVNAFATNQGIIFVNVGLLAQLENEAQLAFVLAHEIAHVQDGHPLEMFLESQKIDRYTKRSDLVQNTSFDDQIVAKNFYSKELESCADSKGLKLFLKSNYSIDELDGVFDVLQYAYLPFDITAIPRSYFENEYIQLPDDYFMAAEDMNGISDTYDEDDSKSTHPSIESRRNAVRTSIGQLSNLLRKKFIQSTKEQFLTLRDIARFELAYYYLHNFRFQDAIYACFVLQQKYPDSKYLHKIIAKSFYGYTKFKNDLKGYNSNNISYNDEGFNTVYMSKNRYKKVEGPSQQVYYLLSQLQANELSVLSLKYLWDACSIFPNDRELLTMRRDLFVDLAYHYSSLTDFSSQTKAAIDAEPTQNSLPDNLTQSNDNKNQEKLSKYDKIKLQQKEKESKLDTKDEDYDFTRYAFANVLQEEAFKIQFQKGQKEKKRRDKISAYYSSSEGREILRKRRKRRVSALGIDSVLVFTPIYKKVESQANASKIMHLKSEEHQARFTDLLRQNAALAKVDITLLNPTELKQTDGATYNDLRMLSDWISQQNRFGGNLLMPSFNQDFIDKLIKKYKTKYLLFTGIISIKKSSTNWAYWSTIYNMESGRYQVIKDDFFRQKDTKIFMNAQLFDTFLQIKSKRKQK